MTRKKLLIPAIILALAVLTVSCNKYNYYYRDQKKPDCTKEAKTSHKFKK